jgi:hypothetical protein
MAPRSFSILIYRIKCMKSVPIRLIIVREDCLVFPGFVDPLSTAHRSQYDAVIR